MAGKKDAKKDEKKESRKGSGVYTIKQATSIKGKPDKRMTTVVRERAVITHAYADDINAGYKTTGKFAEEDEAATKEYSKGKKSDKKAEEAE